MAIEWEYLGEQKVQEQRHHHTVYLSRAKVPGGWLIMVVTTEGGHSITFYPDPQHEWDGDSLP